MAGKYYRLLHPPAAIPWLNMKYLRLQAHPVRLPSSGTVLPELTQRAALLRHLSRVRAPGLVCPTTCPQLRGPLLCLPRRLLGNLPSRTIGLLGLFQRTDASRTYDKTQPILHTGASRWLSEYNPPSDSRAALSLTGLQAVVGMW